MAAASAGVGGPASGPGRLRPLNAIGPVAGSIFTVLAWAAIAHNSGSGWVQALGVVLFAVLLVGLIAPGRVVARARVAVESAPIDAVAGEPLELSIASSARVRIRPVAPRGRTGFFGPRGARRDSLEEAASLPDVAEISARVRASGASTLEIVPDRRGILVAVTVDIASAAPFGIVWWSRRTVLALPVEVSVAPRPTKAFAVPPEGDEENQDLSARRRSASFGETRGVRNYEHGDARRTVHWRASAHTGRLMVREMEMPSAEPLTVRVVLPSDPVEADELAGRALATVMTLLESSRPVMLATHEPDGDRLAQVTGPKDAGRRLARAVANGEAPGSVTIDDPRPAGDLQDRHAQVRIARNGLPGRSP